VSMVYFNSESSTFKKGLNRNSLHWCWCGDWNGKGVGDL